MNEINPKPEYWVLSLSGGKDSTALGLEWLARHKADPVTYPLHEVVYCDTWMEFPAMMEHINQLEKIFMDAGIKFTRVQNLLIGSCLNTNPSATTLNCKIKKVKAGRGRKPVGVLLN